MTPTQMEFFKMSAAGNDFIVFDNRSGVLRAEELAGLAARLTARGLSIGADGVVLLENSQEGDVRARFFNPDGEPTFCGNGARCAARLAYLKGMAPARMTVQTDLMLHRAEVRGTKVLFEMCDPRGLEEVTVDVDGNPFKGTLVDSGVPHFVLFMPINPEESIDTLGAALRAHERFAPGGVNVDFVQQGEDGSLSMRTFERGVARDTLACGSGCVAVAVAAAASGRAVSPVMVRTRAGQSMVVSFEGDVRRPGGVKVEGEARLVYVGQLTEESIQGVTR